MIVIKNDISGFVVTVHSGLVEQYGQFLKAWGLDFLLARTLVHCDKKTLHDPSWSLDISSW